jgi:ankyrin repeat protein
MPDAAKRYTETGNQLIHLAAALDRSMYVYQALLGGAKIDDRTRYSNRTALMFAARFASPKLLKTILETFKANPNLTSIFNQTALHEVFFPRSYISKNLEIGDLVTRAEKAKLLINSMAEEALAIVDIYGKRAVDYIPANSEFSAIRDHLNAIEIKSSREPDTKFLTKKAPAERRLAEIISSLTMTPVAPNKSEIQIPLSTLRDIACQLEKGADVNTVRGGSRKSNLLETSLGARGGVNYQLMDLALSANANVNLQDSKNLFTPIGIAALRAPIEMLAKLLVHGADPSIFPAHAQKSQALHQFLDPAYSPYRAESYKTHRVAKLTVLVLAMHARKDDVNARNDRGQTIFDYFVKNPEFETLTKLMRKHGFKSGSELGAPSSLSGAPPAKPESKKPLWIPLETIRTWGDAPSPDEEKHAAAEQFVAKAIGTVTPQGGGGGGSDVAEKDFDEIGAADAFFGNSDDETK